MPTRVTEDQAKAQGAVGENSEAPHAVTAAQAQQGADSPESREATGQVVAPSDKIVGTNVNIAADPTAEGTRQYAEDQARVKVLQAPKPEDRRQEPRRLPDDVRESAAFKAANSAARDAFANVVRFPGSRFVDHGGRYVNIYDLEDVYDVEPNSVVPDGLYLFPVNYLERDPADVANRTRQA